jgi:hypothetical protein
MKPEYYQSGIIIIAKSLEQLGIACNNLTKSRQMNQHEHATSSKTAQTVIRNQREFWMTLLLRPPIGCGSRRKHQGE